MKLKKDGLVYFIDRITLGNLLAGKLQGYRGKDAIIICLQENSLLTCLTMAMQLRAWVYPLVFEPVYRGAGSSEAIGAIDQDGNFCRPPGAAEAVADDAETLPRLAAAREAVRRQLKAYGVGLNKKLLDGRDVIIAADVLTSPLPLAVVQQLLTTVRPRSLTAVAGNVTPDVAQLVRLSADHSDILDILSGVVFDDSHYFERPDRYSVQQKQQLTQHIAAFWQ